MRIINLIGKRRFRSTRFGSEFPKAIRIEQEPLLKLYAYFDSHIDIECTTEVLMSGSQPSERLIVGTGPAAVASAMALRKRSVPFEVLDVAYDLEPERLETIERLAKLDPDAWSPADRDFLFPPPVASARGVEKRLAFGSDFLYRMPGATKLSNELCKIEMSHGFICTSPPPAPPGSIWWNAGSRCSPSANYAEAYTPVSEPTRPPSSRPSP